MTRYLSVTEFAEQKGLSPETVRRHLRQNRYPGAYKESDTMGWKIPESFLFPSGQITMDLYNKTIAETSRNRQNVLKKHQISSNGLGQAENVVSLAYQIAFLRGPSQEALRKLTLCGVERALEIILVMRQSPNQPIRNPEGFIQKAIVQNWKPDGLHKTKENEQQQVTKTAEQQVSEKASALFDSSGKLYDWVNGG